LYEEMAFVFTYIGLARSRRKAHRFSSNAETRSQYNSGKAKDITMRLSILGLAVVTIFLYSRISIANGLPPLPTSTSRTYHSQDPKLGAVSSLSSECSTVGIDMLKCGGNAADAVSFPSSGAA
jgi:hypothetical protein